MPLRHLHQQSRCRFPYFLRHERTLLALGAIALVSSIMLYWANQLHIPHYLNHIALVDNLQQTRRDINQALIRQEQRNSGETVSPQEIYALLSAAKLHIADCIAGRSSLSGITAQSPTGHVLDLLRRYQQTFLQLTKNIQENLEQHAGNTALHINQVQQVLQTEQLATTLEDFLADDLVQTIEQQQWEQHVGLVFWCTFLILSFFLLSRAVRVEQRHKQQEQLIHALLQATPDAIFIKDCQGRYLFCNNATLTYLQKTSQDIIGKDDRTLFPPDQAKTLMSMDQDILRSNTTIQSNQMLNIGTGEQRLFAISKGQLHDQDGQIIGLYGIARDMTAFHHNEEQLRHHRILLQRTSNLAQVGGWEFNPHTQQGFWTEECAKIHDLPHTETINVQQGLSYFHGTNRIAVEQAVNQAIKHGTPYDLTVEMISAKGVQKWVRTQGSPVMKDGQVQHIYGAIQDISEYKRLEHELRDSETKYRILFEQSMDGIALLEHYPPRFFQVNPAFLRLFGFDDSEDLTKIQGDQIRPLIHPDDFQRVSESLRKRMEGLTDSVRYEFRIIRTDQSIRWIEATGLRISVGNRILNQTICRDVTAQKKAAEEREILQEQLALAQRMEAVGRLAGGVAHDFNNMLGVILGLADMIREQLAPDNPLRSDVGEIRHAAQRSAELTRQLLAFARKQTISPQMLDINTTIEGMLKMLRRLIGEDIKLVWLPHPKLWPVHMDPTQVDQILANLCINARDAITDTGTITIETANVTLHERPRKGLLDCTPGDYVRISVKDTGMGMDQKTQAHIFDPFFTTKEPGIGTGLGLATVYGTIQQNKGCISVVSELYQGTCFTLYFPRFAATNHIQPAPKSPPRPLEPEDYTILLVEDEKSLLELNRRMLVQLGYQVLWTASAKEACTLARQYPGPIHLLLTDVVMPEMNGKELSKSLLELRPTLRCLFMSGYTADVIAHHGVLDQELSFLQKPFTRRELMEKMQEVLG